MHMKSRLAVAIAAACHPITTHDGFREVNFPVCEPVVTSRKRGKKGKVLKDWQRHGK